MLLNSSADQTSDWLLYYTVVVIQSTYSLHVLSSFSLLNHVIFWDSYVCRITTTSVSWCCLPSPAKPRRRKHQLWPYHVLCIGQTPADRRVLNLSLRFARNTGELWTMMLRDITGKTYMIVHHRAAFMLTCMLYKCHSYVVVFEQISLVASVLIEWLNRNV